MLLLLGLWIQCRRREIHGPTTSTGLYVGNHGWPPLGPVGASEDGDSVKTGSTPRGNSESQSYLMMFRTWLHRVWCALVSIVLSVPELVGGLEKVRGARLSCKANR